MPSGPNGKDRARVLIAQEAARILADEGVRDYLLAKRKAAQRLGFPVNVKLPRNLEVEDALRAHQRLFQGTDQSRDLFRLRQSAVEAMTFLARFRPRLVGSVLVGTAGSTSDVNLHLFADTSEEVALFLMENGIPFESGERRLRLSAERAAYFPVYSFAAGDTPIDLTVFPVDGLRQSPLSPVHGRPMERANTRQVRRLLSDEHDCPVHSAPGSSESV